MLCDTFSNCFKLTISIFIIFLPRLPYPTLPSYFMLRPNIMHCLTIQTSMEWLKTFLLFILLNKKYLDVFHLNQEHPSNHWEPHSNNLEHSSNPLEHHGDHRQHSSNHIKHPNNHLQHPSNHPKSIQKNTQAAAIKLQHYFPLLHISNIPGTKNQTAHRNFIF